ncbi:MAG: MerR family transcriptional regulator [Neisseria sp.]|uniref:MerR family transcriptional regulator n=1 Tax=Neisseria sp. TaxID=192066 RepID=UPI0026DA71BD|nr:MerR family transcriptional regulator [Neisseria sp.]MDO4640211.1 MerR family transcriptional regulator [Neisseria sp.]
MKISEVAKKCETSVRMIRFYETLNLIQPVRNNSGYRVYTENDVEIIRKIILLNRTGLPLKDIALMRDCINDEPQDFCNDLRAKLMAKQSDIDRQIACLKASKALLDDLLAR